MLSEQPLKTLSHAVLEITTYRVGILSARTSTVNFCSRLKEATLQRGCHCPAPQARQETQRSMVRGSSDYRLFAF